MINKLANLLLILAPLPLAAQTMSEIDEQWAELEQQVNYRFVVTDVNAPGSPPPEDVPSIGKYSVNCTLSKGRYRIRWSGISSNPAMLTYKQDIAFDGKEYRILNYFGKDIDGTLMRDGGGTVNAWAVPFLIAHRPKDGIGLFRVHGSAIFSSSPEQYEGSECSCLSIKNPKAPALEVSVLVDPARNYVVRRVIVTRGSGRIQEMAFAYQDNDGVPMLEEFSLSEFDSLGALLSKKIGRVVSAKLLDHVDDEEFQLEFPKGIHVRDLKPPPGE